MRLRVKDVGRAELERAMYGPLQFSGPYVEGLAW